MIRITEWTRESRAEKEIETQENGDKKIFELYVSHRNGQYRAHWGQVIDQFKDGYKSRLSIPFADYNGQTTIKDARFSRKWLENADKVIQNNLQVYFELWQAEKYQELCNRLHSDLNA